SRVPPDAPDAPNSHHTRTDASRCVPSRPRRPGHAPSSRAAPLRESEPCTLPSLHPLAGRHARPKALDRAVPDHPHVAFLDPELVADLARRFFPVERQEDDDALARGEPGEAPLEVIDVQ